MRDLNIGVLLFYLPVLVMLGAILVMIYLKGKGWGSWNDQPWGGGGWPRYYKPSHATEAQKKDLLVRIYVLAGLTIIWFLVTTYIIYDPQLNIIGKAFYDFDLWRIKNFN